VHLLRNIAPCEKAEGVFIQNKQIDIEKYKKLTKYKIQNVEQNK